MQRRSELQHAHAAGLLVVHSTRVRKTFARGPIDLPYQTCIFDAY